MNNKNLFNFLTGLAKAMNESGEYQQLDFTKKEDVEKLDNAIKTLKENQFFSELFGNDLFDGLQEKAHKVYEAAHKDDKKVPTRPQLLVSDAIRNNITNLACEYLNTMILPYSNLKEKQVEDILNGLIDFGCWVYKK
jgi:hypothetical protein